MQVTVYKFLLTDMHGPLNVMLQIEQNSLRKLKCERDHFLFDCGVLDWSICIEEDFNQAISGMGGGGRSKKQIETVTLEQYAVIFFTDEILMWVSGVLILHCTLVSFSVWIEILDFVFDFESFPPFLYLISVFRSYSSF